MENDYKNKTELEQLKNEIEAEKLKAELEQVKKQNKEIPFLNRLVNSYMDTLNYWTRWIVQNQLDMIKAERGLITIYKMENDYMDLTESQESKPKEQSKINDHDYLGVPKMDLDLFVLDF